MAHGHGERPQSGGIHQQKYNLSENALIMWWSQRQYHRSQTRKPGWNERWEPSPEPTQAALRSTPKTGYKSRSATISSEVTLPDELTTFHACFVLLNKESAVRSAAASIHSGSEKSLLRVNVSEVAESDNIPGHVVTSDLILTDTFSTSLSQESVLTCEWRAILICALRNSPQKHCPPLGSHSS